MSAKLLYELHTCSVKTLLFRRWVTNARFSNNIHLNSKRNAHTTIEAKDYFQANKGIQWDPEGPLKPLYTLNYLRVPYIRDSLVNVAPGEKFSTCLKGKKILDVGCGGGFLSEALAKLGAEVTGIDTNKEALEHTKKHSSNNMRLANNLPAYIPVTIEASLRQLDLSLLSELWTLSEAMASWRRQLERGPRLRPAPPPPPPPHYLRT